MTLEEIAKEIGVSKSTVSRALSGKGRIGEKTRNRILEVAKRGEEREEMARTRTVTHNIGVVLPSDVYYGSGVYFQNCLLGVCESASMLGYNVLITTSNAHDISELQSLVESNRVDGMLLTRALEDDRALQYLSQANFPTALTGTCRYDNIIQVDTDNEGAAEKMTTLLIGKGFRRFAFLVKDMSYNVDRKRHEGFCRALIKNGISEKDQLFYNGSICGDDEICTMVMSRLQAEGYRIPKDVAIASLYNSTNLDCYSPAVTAVSVAASQMGGTAVRQLIQRLRGENYEKKTMLDYDILFRKSTN